MRFRPELTSYKPSLTNSQKHPIPFLKGKLKGHFLKRKREKLVNSAFTGFLLGGEGGIWFSGIGIATLALRAARSGLPRKRGAGKQSTGLFSFPPVQIPSAYTPSKRASRWDALLLGGEGDSYLLLTSSRTVINTILAKNTAAPDQRKLRYRTGNPLKVRIFSGRRRRGYTLTSVLGLRAALLDARILSNSFFDCKFCNQFLLGG